MYKYLHKYLHYTIRVNLCKGMIDKYCRDRVE